MIETPRLYGTPDEDSDHPPTVGGMRGERTGPREGKTPPRTFEGEDGAPITVQETSGTAGVEAARPADD